MTKKRTSAAALVSGRYKNGNVVAMTSRAEIPKKEFFLIAVSRLLRFMSESSEGVMKVPGTCPSAIMMFAALAKMLRIYFGQEKSV